MTDTDTSAWHVLDNGEYQLEPQSAIERCAFASLFGSEEQQGRMTAFLAERGAR